MGLSSRGVSMRRDRTLGRALVVATTLLSATPCGRATPQEAAGAIDGVPVAPTVEALATVIEREYFAPDVAARVGRTLRRGLGEGRYSALATLEALAQALTRDLLAATADKHLAVSVRRARPAGTTTPADVDRATGARRDNFGVRRLEILAGNVGYLDLTQFYRPEEARDTITAALRTLRNADALILDLRRNGGGSPGTVALVVTDLFAEPGLPLFEIVPRSGGESQAYATELSAIVERNARRPVFALTAGSTFSAGEGLAFLLQERGRAEVVGERTAGAANPGRPYPLNERLEVTVPNGRVRSAVSGRNWEGTGVEPDLPVAAADALRVAHARALQGLLKDASNGAWRDSLLQALATLEGGNPR
jgi:hypothetical protein